MTVEVEYELHPITQLDFEPRCDMENGIGTNEQCTHAAVWQALVLHGENDGRVLCGTEGEVTLFCTCCLARLTASLARHVPTLCPGCRGRLGQVADYLTDVARLK